MGGSKRYLPEGGFTEKTYKQIGTTANGIKILREKKSGDDSLPQYSNTPYTMYAATNDTKGGIKQIKIYGNHYKTLNGDGRRQIKDIDTFHEHKNRVNGKIIRHFDYNDIHVHDYDENGRRSNIARKPSKKERRIIMIAQYGRKQ